MLTALAIKIWFPKLLLLLLLAFECVFQCNFRMDSFIRSFFFCDNEIIAVYLLFRQQL